MSQASSPAPVGSDCHDSRCRCARCMFTRGGQRAIARAERDVIAQALRWAFSNPPIESLLDLALKTDVMRLAALIEDRRMARKEAARRVEERGAAASEARGGEGAGGGA